MKLNKGNKPKYRSVFPKIPKWEKRITLTFKVKPVEFNIELGESSGYKTSGYVS